MCLKRHNGYVTTEALAPTTRWMSIAIVWVLAAAAAICIGIFSRPAEYSAWIALALGGCTVAAFAIQLATQVTNGFVGRLAASLVGALFVLAMATAVLWLVTAGLD